jgi:hypothetical protein
MKKTRRDPAGRVLDSRKPSESIRKQREIERQLMGLDMTILFQKQKIQKF